VRMHAEAARQRGTAHVARMLPLGLAPSAAQPDAGALQDESLLLRSLHLEETAPFLASAAETSAAPAQPAAHLRSMHCSAVLCQSLCDLLQVHPARHAPLPLSDFTATLPACTSAPLCLPAHRRCCACAIQTRGCMHAGLAAADSEHDAFQKLLPDATARCRMHQACTCPRGAPEAPH
jgi:hypothetical protein